MTLEEFIQLVQTGLPKFKEDMERQREENPEHDWDEMIESDWYDAYDYWACSHGIGGTKR